MAKTEQEKMFQGDGTPCGKNLSQTRISVKAWGRSGHKKYRLRWKNNTDGKRLRRPN